MTKFHSIIATIVGLLIFTLLSACQPEPAATVAVDNEITVVAPELPESGNPTIEPYEFATSKSGFVTVHGLLVVRDPTSILPGPDDAVFLVPMDAEGAGVTGIPQFTVGEVPQADVDERTGEFVFVDIQPGKYAVVVMTVGGSQIPTRLMEDGSFSIFTFTEEQLDQVVELGSLSLP
jgi:hypothetical protein